MTKPPFWDWRKTMYLLNSLDCCEISQGFSVTQILRKRSWKAYSFLHSTATWLVRGWPFSGCSKMHRNEQPHGKLYGKVGMSHIKIENTTSNHGDTEILDNFHSPVIHLPLIVPHPSLQKNPHLLVPVVNIRRSIKLVIVPLSRLSLAVVRFRTFYTGGCLFWQVARDCGDNPVVNLWFLKTQKHLYPLTSLTRDCRSFWEGIVFPSANYFGWVSKWGTSRLHSLQTKTCQNEGGFGPGPLPKKNVKRLVCDSTHPKQKTCSKPSKNHWLIYPSTPPIIWSFGGIHSNEIRKYQENFTHLWSLSFFPCPFFPPLVPQVTGQDLVHQCRRRICLPKWWPSLERGKQPGNGWSVMVGNYG